MRRLDRGTTLIRDHSWNELVAEQKHAVEGQAQLSAGIDRVELFPRVASAGHGHLSSGRQMAMMGHHAQCGEADPGGGTSSRHEAPTGGLGVVSRRPAGPPQPAGHEYQRRIDVCQLTLDASHQVVRPRGRLRASWVVGPGVVVLYIVALPLRRARQRPRAPKPLGVPARLGEPLVSICGTSLVVQSGRRTHMWETGPVLAPPIYP